MSKSIIFLVKTFLGIFYRHLAIFIWSHCLVGTFQKHYIQIKEETNTFSTSGLKDGGSPRTTFVAAISFGDSKEDEKFSRLMLEESLLRYSDLGIKSVRAFERIFKAMSVWFNPLVSILFVGMAADAGSFSLNAMQCRDQF